MINNKIEQLIEENLPNEIDGFQRRVAVIDNYSTIIYSKDGGLLVKNLSGSILDSDYIDRNLLFEVIGNSLEESYQKISEKIDLNSKIKSDFPTNIIIDFRPNFKYTNGKNETLIKLFEIYLVLDTNSDSQFFCVATINPYFDSRFILPVVSELKNKIKNKSLLTLTGEDFDYSDFNLPTIIHFYSYDFLKKKDEIKEYFKKNNWNIKFRDNYYFEKQKSVKKRKTILCEGKNFKLFNNLDIPNIDFSEEHNSNSIFQNVKTKTRFCLRDKDLLIDEEITRLKKKFPNYYILDYYCIENYLYHPDNISELNLYEFNKKDYINDIIKSKNEAFLDLVSNFKITRKGYKELSENHIKIVKNADKILLHELESNEFNVFYKHFDMKSKYKKNFLQKFNLNDSKLSKTKWFKARLIQIIN